MPGESILRFRGASRSVGETAADFPEAENVGKDSELVLRSTRDTVLHFTRIIITYKGTQHLNSNNPGSNVLHIRIRVITCFRCTQTPGVLPSDVN